MNSFLQKYQQFMYGRNGFDKLTVGLSILYCLFTAVKSFLRNNLTAYIIVSVFQYALLAFTIFRVLSRNLAKRYNENYKFEQFLTVFKPYFSHAKLRLTYIRTHRFRKCKCCGEFLRLKRIRGIRNVTCPKCGKECKFFILF